MSKILLHIRHRCAECGSTEDYSTLVRTFSENADFEWERFGGMGIPKVCTHLVRGKDEYYIGYKVLNVILNPNGFGWIIETEDSRYKIDPVDLCQLYSRTELHLAKHIIGIRPIDSSDDILSIKEVWKFIDQYDKFDQLCRISDIARKV